MKPPPIPGKEALFESESYSYYALSSTRLSTKEATLTDGKWSFGKATGAASEDTATIAKFKTSGHHADYEMKVESDKITKGPEGLRRCPDRHGRQQLRPAPRNRNLARNRAWLRV